MSFHAWLITLKRVSLLLTLPRVTSDYLCGPIVFPYVYILYFPFPSRVIMINDDPGNVGVQVSL